MSTPKFQIGEAVTHQSTLEEVRSSLLLAKAAADKTLIRGFPVAVITHIYVEQCHGGCTQITYQVENADVGKRWIESAIVPAVEARAEIEPLALKVITADRERKTAMRKQEIEELWTKKKEK